MNFFDRRDKELAIIEGLLDRGDVSFSSLPVVFQARLTPVSLPVAHVTRGEYSQVQTVLETSVSGQAIVQGPTSSGKSTFGLLDLLPYHKTLLVQPNNSTIANILKEFNEEMQVFVKNNPGVYPEPPLCEQIDLDITAEWFLPGSLYVTSVTDLLNYMSKYHSLPHFSLIVVDEFHFPERDMVSVVGLLQAIDHHVGVLYISATPPGLPLLPGNPVDVVDAPVDGFVRSEDPPRDILDTVWDPTELMTTQGTVVYAVATDNIAIGLKESLQVLGFTDVAVVTENTTVQEYTQMVKNVQPGKIFILTPKVEFGVTIPDVAWFIDSGRTETTVFEDGVIYVTSRNVTAAESKQRRGRGGRHRKTYYIGPSAPEYYTGSASGDFFAACLCVRLIAMGVPYSALPFKPAFAVKKLSSLTQACAVAAQKDVSMNPYVNTHKYNSKGEKYKVFGGTADNFEVDNIDYLRVFMKKEKYFIAPVADLTDANSDPDKFITDRSESLKMSSEILKHSGKSVSLKQCVLAFAENPARYMDDLCTALDNETASWKSEYTNSESSARSWKTLFETPELLLLGNAMETVVTFSVDEKPSSISGKVDFTVRFKYKDKLHTLSLPAVFRPKLNDDGSQSFDMEHAAKEYTRVLSPIVSIAGVVANTAAVTKLDKLASVLEKSNSWFASF